MNQTSSLYELIKQISQQKGRPLKIVCDWDECLQPVNPLIWHKLAKEKGWTIPNNLDFNEWFQYFWENAQIKYEQNLPRTKNTTIKEIEEIRSDEKQFEEMIRKPYFAIMNNLNYYKEAPFLSISNGLLLALKDNLINKLVIVSASTNVADSRKRKKFNKTFALFPNTELSLHEMGRVKRGKYRWQWIKEEHPDFDLFIDDSPLIITDTSKYLPADKVYAIPDYKINHPYFPKGGNIYCLKVKVSDLKDEDFIKAAAEYQAKQVNNKAINYPLWISLGLGGMALLGIIGYFLFRKKK